MFTADSAVGLVRDYLQRDIPVGTTIIDSRWETGYNTFEVNLERYPNPPALVDTLHAMGVRVFLWITSMINVETPQYAYARERNYLLNQGRTVEWWHGEGSFLDYTHPEAVRWWHSLMDPVLSLGIDGWKADGSDPYTYLLGIPRGYGGVVAPQQYSDAYYRDFYEYTRQRLGNDRVITARPVASLAGPLTYTFAPRDVNHAGWVGDQDPTFAGLRMALGLMFASARAGYVNVGSDIGGFRGGEGRAKSLLIRWAQLGALSPIMENGGNGEHRPWMYDDETVQIYRRFVKLHHELIPYLYSQGASAYAQGRPLMEPQGGAWQYLLGQSIFVTAITEDVSWRSIEFPPGEWIDFWSGDVYRGPSTVDYQVPLDRYPIFLRRGDIIPLHVVDDALGHGEVSSAHLLTVLIHPGQEASFDLYEETSRGATIRYQREDALTVEVSAIDRDILFLIRGESRPAAIMTEPWGSLPEQPDRDTLAASPRGWRWDASRQELWIKPGAAGQGVRLHILPAPVTP